MEVSCHRCYTHNPVYIRHACLATHAKTTQHAGQSRQASQSSNVQVEHLVSIRQGCFLRGCSCPIRFWLLGQSPTFDANKATELAVRFSKWIHVLSDKSEVACFHSRGSFRLCIGSCTVGKDSNNTSVEADFKLGTPRRVSGSFHEVYGWFPRFIGQKRT